MAINLNKEEYQKNSEPTPDNVTESRPIREVFPTYNDPPYSNGTIGEDGEIYPVREIYPQPSIKVSEENPPAKLPQNDILPPQKTKEKDMTGRFLEPRIYIRKPLKLIFVLIAIAVLTVLVSFSIVYNMEDWQFWTSR